MMKNAIFVAIAAMAAFVLIASAQAADVGFDVNLNINNQARPREVFMRPALAPQPIFIQEAPEFVLPPGLGFYVAVGVPYDLYCISDSYFLFKRGIWYRAPYYNGPWAAVSYRSLPYGLRKQRHERVTLIRDEEYRRFRDDGEGYSARHFRPDKEWKEMRKEEHGRWKEEKEREKESRKHRKHHDDDND